MARALDTLIQEHRDMEKLLHALERQLAAFDEGELIDYEIVEAIVDYSLAYPVLCHHPVENVIYDLICQHDPGALNSRVNLEAEHKKLAELTRKFSALLKGVMQETPTPRKWFDKTARDYIDFARRHMEMEEKYFFPRMPSCRTMTGSVSRSASTARRIRYSAQECMNASGSYGRISLPGKTVGSHKPNEVTPEAPVCQPSADNA